MYCFFELSRMIWYSVLSIILMEYREKSRDNPSNITEIISISKIIWIPPERVLWVIDAKIKDAMGRDYTRISDGKAVKSLFSEYFKAALTQSDFLRSYEALQVAFLQDFAEKSANRVDQYRKKRDDYHDSERELRDKFGTNDDAKRIFLLEELLWNNIEMNLLPRVAILARAFAPRVPFENHLYDERSYKKFSLETKNLDEYYWLDVYGEIEKLGKSGKNIWENRTDIYRYIVEKLNPKWKHWILSMLKHGNWIKMTSTPWYTTDPQSPNKDIWDMIRAYDDILSQLLRTTGELNKSRIIAQKWFPLEIPTASEALNDTIPPMKLPLKMNGLLSFLQSIVWEYSWAEDIENGIDGITRHGTWLSSVERVWSVLDGSLTLVSYFIAGYWSVRALSKGARLYQWLVQVLPIVLSGASAWEKALLRNLLEKLFWKKNNLLKQIKS